MASTVNNSRILSTRSRSPVGTSGTSSAGDFYSARGISEVEQLGTVAPFRMPLIPHFLIVCMAAGAKPARQI